jgi:glycosyltransferase involved in cell wall biosynthesis
MFGAPNDQQAGLHSMEPPKRKTLVYVVTEDWYFWLHRLALGKAALEAGFDVIVVARVQEHGARLAEAGFRVVALPWRRRGGTLWAELASLRLLWRLFRRERPSIVHSIALKSIIYGGLIARLAGVRNRIATIAGLGYVFTSGRLKARLLRPAVLLALKAAMGGRRSVVLLENHDDGRVLASGGAIDPGQIALVSNCGVDTDRFPAYSEPPGPVTIGMATRLVRDKGAAVAVEAMRMLREQNIPARFRLIGGIDEGNPDAHTRQEVMSWVGEGLVQWDGHIDDVAGFWRDCHICLYPSRYGEGVPRTLLEAASCGRPIVTADRPGCRDAVEDGVTGYIAPPDDPQRIADCLRRLIEDADLRRRFGAAARTKALAEFADPVVLGKVMAIYRGVAA